MKYLQTVMVWLDSDAFEEEIKKLAETLAADGIGLINVREVRPAGHESDIPPESAAALNKPPQSFAHPTEQRTAPRIWLTDGALRAAALRREGEAVLALLHEDNREQDFSGILYACEHPEELDADFMERVYRRCTGMPWDVAETDRCLIRETTEADVEAFFQIYADPAVTHYTESLLSTMEEERGYVREYIEKIYGFYGFGVWTVLKKETGEVIGRAGFSLREGYEEPELGFVIGVPWQRQGFAEEVCRALLEYAREELCFPGVQTLVMLENKPSAQLCEKLGFRQTGTEEIAGVTYRRYVKTL